MTTWNYYQVLETGDMIAYIRHSHEFSIFTKRKIFVYKKVPHVLYWICDTKNNSNTISAALTTFQPYFDGLISIYDIKGIK